MPNKQVSSHGSRSHETALRLNGAPRAQDATIGKGRPNADKFCPDSKILKRLGPAAREIGSGLIILQWDVSDGRVFAVSTGDLCAKPHQVVGGRF